MNTYFREPRLHFGAFQNFLIRLTIYCFYTGLVMGFFFLIFSNPISFRWIGFLLGLFLIDRMLHIGEAEISIKEALRSKKDINIARIFTPLSYGILERSFSKALITRRDFYLLIIKESLRMSDSKEIIRRIGIDYDEFSAVFKQFFEDEVRTYNHDELLQIADELAKSVYEIARDANEKFIEPRDIFVAVMILDNDLIKQLRDSLKINIGDIKESVVLAKYSSSFLGAKRLPFSFGGFSHHPHFLRHRVMNRAWTARPTPNLDNFSMDLTDLARNKRIGFLIGHDEEFEKVLDVISRPGKPNVLLVGESGSGKTTIVHHLAFKIIKDEVPDFLFDKRVVSIEIGSLFSDADPTLISKRLQKFSEEIMSAGNVIIFISDIHNLFKSSGTGGIRAIDAFLPIIRNSSMPVIGATYPKEFKRYIERNSDFLEQFEVVRVEEVTEDEAMRFLLYHSLMLERDFGLWVTIGAVRRVVEIAHRYIRTKPLPASAVDLLDEAFAKASRNKIKILDDTTITSIIEEKIHIPIKGAPEDEAEELLILEDIIHRRLVNQNEAVSAISNSLREYRSGLSRKGGPIAVFLFVGPTGVGKTELAKILADVQFGSRDAIVRFDMSEYQDKQSIDKLIGTSDGATTGALTDAIFERPYSLILLDEFEKANPDVLNIFLQVFDDGRLTDGLGRVVDFKNTLIVATSNAHSDFIKEEIEKGFNTEEISEALTGKLTQYFKPELINRFSDIIVFRSLNKKEIFKVTELLIDELKETIKKSNGIEFFVESGIIEQLTELGYSKVFGARPLRKVISNKIKSRLAEMILRKEISWGDKVVARLKQGNFVFEKQNLRIRKIRK